MLRLMRDVGPEITTHHTVPSWVVLFVELLLDVGRNVFLDVKLLKSHIRTVDCILLHLFVHIGMLDHSLAFCCRHINVFKYNK